MLAVFLRTGRQFDTFCLDKDEDDEDPMTPEKIGRYVITGELGKGAMGVVYRATDPNIGRTLALKTMRLDIHGASSKDMLARFQNEARAAGVLNHRNLVTIYDAGEADGMFYIAMEFIAGSTLAGLLQQRKTLPAEEAARIGAQICEGLDYAHYKGVIHRDIKPANIMIAGDGTVKIMDFGIAKAGAGLTHTGEVLGTPNYMSPEQVRGRVLDGRTDLFSTGVMLYEMLTGEKPFNANSVTTIIYKIINEVPPPPRELDASIPSGLSAVIAKAMAKSPDERYQSGSAMAAALEDPFTLSSELTSGTADGAVTTHFFAATGSSPAAGIRNTISGTAVLTPVSVAEPAFTPAVVLGTTSKKRVAEPEPVVERAIAVLPAKPVVPARITPVAAKKRGQGMVFALVVIAVVCLLGLANAARKHKKELAVAETKPVAVQSVPAVASSAPVQKAALISSDAPAQAKPKVESAKLESSEPKSSASVAPKKGESYLALSSDPVGAEIVVDGLPTGLTTPTTLTVDSGQHKVLLHKAGYRWAETLADAGPGQTVNFAPQLQPGNMFGREKTRLAAWRTFEQTGQLPAGKGGLQIRTNPPGAQITVNDIPVPRATPFRFPVAPGTYRVRLSMDGYYAITKIVQVDAGNMTQVNEKLQGK